MVCSYLHQDLIRDTLGIDLYQGSQPQRLRNIHSAAVTHLQSDSSQIRGSEATRVVDEAQETKISHKEGGLVATFIRGIGRSSDGGHAEHTVMPAAQVQVGRRCHCEVPRPFCRY